MAKHYAIYFKKMKDDALVVEPFDNWGIVCKEFPFKLYGNAKELPVNDWKDKDGDDEYVPKGLKMSAYEMDVDFVYKGDMGTANLNVKGFLDYLTGRDGTGAELMVYDTFTKIGRQRVRFSAVSEDIFSRQSGGVDVLVFTVTFKVNDPVTDVVLAYE